MRLPLVLNHRPTNPFVKSPLVHVLGGTWMVESNREIPPFTLHLPDEDVTIRAGETFSNENPVSVCLSFPLLQTYQFPFSIYLNGPNFS